MLPGWITSPNGMASRIMISAWNIRTTTSRSDRPSSIEARLIGVTRMRSTTPLRSSAMSPKPPNAVPKIAIWMISPGTNQLNAFVPAPACFTAPSRSGPKRTRYRTGSIIPNTTQVGCRRVRMSDRWKMSQVSRMVFMSWVLS